MIKNYLVITIRNLARNRIFMLINLFGLGIAIGCCIVAYLNWNFAASFDKIHIRGDVVYRVQANHVTSDGSDRYAVVPAALGEIVRNNFNDVQGVVRYAASTADFRISDDVFNTSVAFADTPFFEFFSFRIIDGSSASFKTKSTIIISESLARKYFDDVLVSGRQITQLIDGMPKEFTIGGVFEDQPLNSSFGFDAIMPWQNYEDLPGIAENIDQSWSAMTTLFLLIERNEDVAQITTQLQRYLKLQNEARDDFRLSSFYLQPFSSLAASFHGDTWLQGEQLRWGIPPSSTIGPAVMGAFLLLLACFNFTNTSLAVSVKRLKEIGVRKAIGGQRSQLITQFMNESVLLCLLACVIGYVIALILTPAYNSLWPGIKLSMRESSDMLFFGFFVALLLITSVIAGAYPALYVTSFRPGTILKGNAMLKGTNWLSRVLLTLQFAIALLCLASAAAFLSNASFQRDFDIGYLKDGNIVVPVADRNQYEQLKNSLSGNKDIDAIAGSHTHVSDRFDRGTVKYMTDEHQVEIVEAGTGYLDAMGIRLIEGRDFHINASSNEMASVLVSEEFVKQFGWSKDVIGKIITWHDSIQLNVVGVLKNIHTEGYWKPVAPVMIRYASEDQYRQLVVRTTPDKVARVNDAMREAWKNVSTNSVYPGKFTDGNIATALMINNNTVRIFGFLGIVALILSTTGLYAILSLNIARRKKEIGIRKVMGARAFYIARLINTEFIFILLIASLLGGSCGYLASDKVMNIIWEYYQPSGIGTVAMAVGVMFATALLAISRITLEAARSNPIHALRDE
ncbi:ABC transporter permease [Chryseolinea sp. T2]|uniref:ABC transporter permease n=1 Tax=Chryseolinea sp. T2 TaxID=3129255 RepID=UPI003076D571